MTDQTENQADSSTPEQATPPVAAPDAPAAQQPADTVTTADAPVDSQAEPADFTGFIGTWSKSTHIRTLITEALTELGKLEQFTAEELEQFWKALSAKL